MSVRPNSADEQFNPAGGGNLPLIVLALSAQIRRVPVQDVHALRPDVNMLEEVVEHVVVVALRVVPRNPDVLVHVKRDDMLEGDLAGLVGAHQVPVHAEGSAARRQAQHEGARSVRPEFRDPFDDVFGRPFRHLVGRVPDDELHVGGAAERGHGTTG